MENFNAYLFCLSDAFFSFVVKFSFLQGTRSKKFIIVVLKLFTERVVAVGDRLVIFRLSFTPRVFLLEYKALGPVVQSLDSAIHRINHYPVDK